MDTSIHISGIPDEKRKSRDFAMVENAESMLQQGKFINENETIYALLLKPYSQVLNTTERLFYLLKEEYKEVPNERRGRMLFYYVFMFTFSDAFYVIWESTENETIKANADKIRKDLSRRLISDLSPYIVMFLKWDLNRRVWKHSNDEYKIEYLKNLVSELDNELQGKSNLLKKYVSLMLDFIVEKFDEGMKDIDPEELKKFPYEDKDIFKMRNEIATLTNSSKLSEFLDEGVESNFLELYKPLAENYLEGMLKLTTRFDYVFYTFIEAQNDYKKFIMNILGIINTPELNYLSDIKNSLNQLNITKALKIIRSIFASVPNELIKNTTEAYYHIYMHLILKLIGCDIFSEVSTNIGRIDAVVELKDLIYIIEFKMTSSEAALNQIFEKKYYESYLNKNLPVYLLGISFDSMERNISEKYKLNKAN